MKPMSMYKLCSYIYHLRTLFFIHKEDGKTDKARLTKAMRAKLAKGMSAKLESAINKTKEFVKNCASQSTRKQRNICECTRIENTHELYHKAKTQ